MMDESPRGNGAVRGREHPSNNKKTKHLKRAEKFL